MTVHELAQRLPDATTLRKWSQSLAVLDAIFSEDWDSRYFSYNQDWSENEEVASMTNGSGDEYSVTFTPGGVFLRAFDHESDLSPYVQDERELLDHILEGLPDALREAANEPAWSDEDTMRSTLALWQLTGETTWSHGNVPEELVGIPDGSELLACLDGNPQTYIDFVEEYFEVEADLEVVSTIYDHQPLTATMVQTLNPERDVDELRSELAEIGYPLVF